MTRWTLLLALIVGCKATDSADDTDTDLASSDNTTDDDATDDDTDDTTSDDDTTDDTDDTDVEPQGCTLGGLTAATQLDDEPTSGQDVTFVRTIEACYDDTTLTGIWYVRIDNEDDDRWCGYSVEFSANSTTTDEGCTDCDVIFEDVTFTNATYTDSTLCGIFGLDADFTSGLEPQYDLMGFDESAPDQLARSKGWYSLDYAEGTVKTIEAVDGDSHYKSVYDITYEYNNF